MSMVRVFDRPYVTTHRIELLYQLNHQREFPLFFRPMICTRFIFVSFDVTVYSFE